MLSFMPKKINFFTQLVNQKTYLETVSLLKHIKVHCIIMSDEMEISNGITYKMYI